jgi:hypothetical protein
VQNEARLSTQVEEKRLLATTDISAKEDISSMISKKLQRRGASASSGFRPDRYNNHAGRFGEGGSMPFFKVGDVGVGAIPTPPPEALMLRWQLLERRWGLKTGTS